MCNQVLSFPFIWVWNNFSDLAGFVTVHLEVSGATWKKHPPPAILRQEFCRITYGYSRIGAMWVSTFFKNWRYQFLNKEIWLLIQWCNSGCYFQNRKEGFFFYNYLTVLMPFSINKIQKFCSFNIFQFLQSINSDYYK